MSGPAPIEVYGSFDEVPVDDVPDDAWDGDDALLANADWAHPGAPSNAAAPALSAEKMSAPAAQRLVVPHPRDLKRGMRGQDVLALQRAAAKAGLRKWGVNFTGQFGPGLERQIKTFQRKHGLVADGVYGPATHRAMARYYDSYGLRLINRVHARTPAEIRLANLMSGAMTLYNRRGVVHYTQGRARMMIVRQHLKLPQLATVPYLYEDCSSSTTGLYYVAGLEDPNKLGYNGEGFTGTQSIHGTRVGTGRGKPGSLNFYGFSFPYHHVTMTLTSGRCFSHGSEVGPLVLSPWYRSDLTMTREYPGLP